MVVLPQSEKAVMTTSDFDIYRAAAEFVEV